VPLSCSHSGVTAVLGPEGGGSNGLRRRLEEGSVIWAGECVAEQEQRDTRREWVMGRGGESGE